MEFSYERDVGAIAPTSSRGGLILHSKRFSFEDTLLAGSTAILSTGGLDVIRNEAWPFYRTISGVCLYWELDEAEGPEGQSHRH